MTVNVTVGAAPSNLVTDAGLTEGERYIVEVVRGSSFVRYWEGASAPADLSYFHALSPGEKVPIRPVAGVGIWLWRADADREARLVVTDNAP